jgi:hypothetical protein
MNLQKKILYDFDYYPKYTYINDNQITLELPNNFYQFIVKDNNVLFSYMKDKENKKFFIEADNNSKRSIIDLQVRNILTLHNFPYEFMTCKNDDVLCKEVYAGKIQNKKKEKDVFEAYLNTLAFGVTPEIIDKIKEKDLLKSYSFILHAYLGIKIC